MAQLLIMVIFLAMLGLAGWSILHDLTRPLIMQPDREIDEWLAQQRRATAPLPPRHRKARVVSSPSVRPRRAAVA